MCDPPQPRAEQLAERVRRAQPGDHSQPAGRFAILDGAYGPGGPVGTNPLGRPVERSLFDPDGPIWLAANVRCAPMPPVEPVGPKPPLPPKDTPAPTDAEPVGPVTLTAEVVNDRDRPIFAKSDSGPCGIGGGNPSCALHGCAAGQ